MANSFNRAALGTYDDFDANSRKSNYVEKFDDSVQSNLVEKLDQIQKKDLFFILSISTFGVFVTLYFLLYLFLWYWLDKR